MIRFTNFDFSHLSGSPEVVIAVVEASEEPARFLETPIFAELVASRGNPLR